MITKDPKELELSLIRQDIDHIKRSHKKVALGFIILWLATIGAGFVAGEQINHNNYVATKAASSSSQLAEQVAVNAERSARFSCEQTNERNIDAIQTLSKTVILKKSSIAEIINAVVPYRNCTVYTYDRVHGLEYPTGP